jgi:hypothetical protein
MSSLERLGIFSKVDGEDIRWIKQMQDFCKDGKGKQVRLCVNV